MRLNLKSARFDIESAMTALTEDTFFNGRLIIKQPASGYRFSMDAVLLAQQTKLKSTDRVLDLGCGCGVIALILAYRYPKIKIWGVEIQHQLSKIAAKNVAENRMQDRITILNRDLKTLTAAMTSGPVDVVVCNPPHGKAKSARINPGAQLAIARHEIRMTSDDLLSAADRMLKPDGRIIAVYPMGRMLDILGRMRAFGLEPKRLTMIHTKPGTNAKRFLVEGVKGDGPGITVTPAIHIRHPSGGSLTDFHSG